MSGSITAWLDLLRQGNDLAAEKLWDYFSPNLQNQLAPSCQSLKICDEEDIAITSFYRLVTAMQNGASYPVTDRKEFWRLLLTISKRAIGDWRKYDGAVCRGGRAQTIPIDTGMQPVAANSRVQMRSEQELFGQFAEMAEKMDRPEFLQVIELKQRGMTNAEIATEIGMSLRTVQYIIRDIKDAWVTTFGESREQLRVA